MRRGSARAILTEIGWVALGVVVIAVAVTLIGYLLVSGVLQ